MLLTVDRNTTMTGVRFPSATLDLSGAVQAFDWGGVRKQEAFGVGNTPR